MRMLLRGQIQVEAPSQDKGHSYACPDVPRAHFSIPRVRDGFKI